MLSKKPETLITTYLEMTSREQFQASFIYDAAIRIEPMTIIDIPFYLFLYQTVGENLSWRDRILMPKAELHAALSSPATSIFVLYLGAVPAGYVELHQNSDSVEIAVLGLREGYHGRGLGKHLLSFGIQKAWDLGAKRVWVHTCNLDGAAALPNYEKRGFKVYDVTEEAMPSRYQ